MPNHITNIVKVLSLGNSTIEQVRARILNNKGDIDFNVVFGMQECLKGFNPHHGAISVANAKLQTPVSGNPMIAIMEIENRERALQGVEGLSEEDKALVQRCIDNYKESGFVYWYDWANEVWGTKWNAYNQSVQPLCFKFDTAWGHPEKVINKISKDLPDVEFSIQYADEDTGSNCGSYIVKNGVRSSEDIAPNWSQMSIDQKRKYTEFAFRICHPETDQKEYGYDENWDYIEED